MQFLKDAGFTVKTQAYGIATSFEATYGSEGRCVTFNAEYDALPGPEGPLHSCGHNLIATSSTAAFVAIAEALKGDARGRVRLLGTPAEEGGGGKIKLIAAGAFEDVDACFLTHPIPMLPQLKGYPGGLADARTDATSKILVKFTGKPAHASMSPWIGKNALDAAVLAYNGISMLRQQIKPDERIHGCIVNGGDKTNVIPDTAVLEFQVRASSRRGATQLQSRIEQCFKGAALSTGCTVEIEQGLQYNDMRFNKPLSREYANIMSGKGHPTSCQFSETGSRFPAAGDQGNVSYECPAFHGGFIIPAEKGSFNHTPGFAKAAGSEEAFQAALLSAKVMALTALRVLEDDEFAAAVKKNFEDDRKIRDSDV